VVVWCGVCGVKGVKDGYRDIKKRMKKIPNVEFFFVYTSEDLK
jgi:hypothetical protein